MNDWSFISFSSVLRELSYSNFVKSFVYFFVNERYSSEPVNVLHIPQMSKIISTFPVWGVTYIFYIITWFLRELCYYWQCNNLPCNSSLHSGFFTFTTNYKLSFPLCSAQAHLTSSYSQSKNFLSSFSLPFFWIRPVFVIISLLPILESVFRTQFRFHCFKCSS